jgi:hypothetical protein
MIHRGESNQFAKLTASQVVAIRLAWRHGNGTRKELAYEYRVSPRAISDIVRRVTWRHVP